MNFTNTSATCAAAPAMGYGVDIAMWNLGRMDSWCTARAAGFGMGHFDRYDLPFYYALADAFTIGDQVCRIRQYSVFHGCFALRQYLRRAEPCPRPLAQYFQSAYTATNPNRMFLFSGSNGPSAGTVPPCLDDSEPVPGCECGPLRRHSTCHRRPGLHHSCRELDDGGRDIGGSQRQLARVSGCGCPTRRGRFLWSASVAPFVQSGITLTTTASRGFRSFRSPSLEASGGTRCVLRAKRREPT